MHGSQKVGWQVQRVVRKLNGTFGLWCKSLDFKTVQGFGAAALGILCTAFVFLFKKGYDNISS